MKKVPYYPGCSLKSNYKYFEDSAIESFKVLGYELVELPRWNCCGTVYSLSSDNLMGKIAPIRNLIRVKEQNENRIVTLCSVCYSTLKLANDFIRENKDANEKMNNFMDREDIKYEGDVEVLHLLQLLRDEIGFEKVKKCVKKELKGLKVAPYYGCLLLRPKEAAIDNVEAPTVLEDFLSALGAESIDFPFKNECCGAYHTVNERDLVAEKTMTIINYAKRNGADLIVNSCPLCQFNLDWRQKLAKEKHPDFEGLPVLYFTQLMAIAFGLKEDFLQMDKHYVKPDLAILTK